MCAGTAESKSSSHPNPAHSTVAKLATSVQQASTGIDHGNSAPESHSSTTAQVHPDNQAPAMVDEHDNGAHHQAKKQDEAHSSSTEVHNAATKPALHSTVASHESNPAVEKAPAEHASASAKNSDAQHKSDENSKQQAHTASSSHAAATRNVASAPAEKHTDATEPHLAAPVLPQKPASEQHTAISHQAAVTHEKGSVAKPIINAHPHAVAVGKESVAEKHSSHEATQKGAVSKSEDTKKEAATDDKDSSSTKMEKDGKKAKEEEQKEIKKEAAAQVKEIDPLHIINKALTVRICMCVCVCVCVQRGGSADEGH